MLLVSVAGCGRGAPAGVEKTYDLDGRKVSFVAPPVPWKEVLIPEEVDLRDGSMKEEGKPQSIGVSFAREDQNLKGSFSVAVMDQNFDLAVDPKTRKVTRSEFIELENDQETLDYLAMWIDKRDGKRLTQEYIKVAGVNAFHMVFELGPEADRMKGEQVHFTKDGSQYSISMIVPIKEYSANLKTYQDMVSSFKIVSSPPADKPAVGSLMRAPSKKKRAITL